jgi:hypothetical protein
MTTVSLGLTLSLLTALPGQIGTGSAPAVPDKGTYLGALFAPVSAPRTQGVVITHVLPNSPASQVDLRRQDVLVRYDDEVIASCEQLAKRIQADRPERKVRLGLLREDKPLTVEVVLALGPALRLTPEMAKSGAEDMPGAVAKPAGKPHALSISATPLPEGKMRVQIEYYQEGTGRLRTVSCEGNAADIREGLLQLDKPERDLARAALESLRVLPASSSIRKP